MAAKLLAAVWSGESGSATRRARGADAAGLCGVGTPRGQSSFSYGASAESYVPLWHPAICVLAGHWVTFVTDRAVLGICMPALRAPVLLRRAGQSDLISTNSLRLAGRSGRRSPLVLCSSKSTNSRAACSSCRIHLSRRSGRSRSRSWVRIGV
jgi:hypothetical protein